MTPVFDGSDGAQRLHVDGSLTLVAVAWGSTYLVAKELVTQQTVLSLLAVRMLLAATVLGLIVAARRRSLRWREVRVGAVLGAVLATVFLFETFGVAATTATNAGLVISLTIIFTPLLERALGGRALSRWFYLAAVATVVGVCLLSSGGIAGRFGPGEALVLGAALFRAVHVVTMHLESRGAPLDSLNLTFVQMTTCGALFLAASSLWGTSVTSYVGSLEHTAVAQLAYLVVGCTVFPFLVQMWAVRRTSPTRVSLLLGTEPVWAAVIGVSVAGDAFGPAGVAGMVLVIAGVQAGRAVENRRSVQDPRESPTKIGAPLDATLHDLKEPL